MVCEIDFYPYKASNVRIKENNWRSSLYFKKILKIRILTQIKKKMNVMS